MDQPGHEFGGFTVPAQQVIDAFLERQQGAVLGLLLELAGDLMKVIGPAAQVGFDGLAEEAVDQAAHGGLGLVEGASVAGLMNHVECADAGEEAQSVAGGAFADAGLLDHLVKTERFRGAEQGAVEFADGARERQGMGQIDKESDQFPAGIEWLWTAGWGWRGFALAGGFRDLIHDADSWFKGF